MLETTVWIAQSFLALFFLGAGIPKIIGRGIDRWIGFDEIPRPLTIVIGLTEGAAAIALIVPMLADEARWTTPLAALGISVVSLMASGFHVRNGEWLPAVETSLWASLAGSVAIARWDEMPTGPSISTDVLIPVIAVLVPAIIGNLIILSRQPVQRHSDPRNEETQLITATE